MSPHDQRFPGSSRDFPSVPEKPAHEKRKWMGIEPTRHVLTHLNGFEDRDDHQIAITSRADMLCHSDTAFNLHDCFRLSWFTNTADFDGDMKMGPDRSDSTPDDLDWIGGRSGPNCLFLHQTVRLRSPVVQR